MSSYFYLHPASGRSWPTDDPNHWLLDRGDDDLLAAARERLVASPDDPNRCCRAVLRRCDLVLLHVASDERVVVRHWSEPAPDLRTWAKKQGFNRAGLAVTFVNVKTGTVVVHEDGSDLLLHGERVGDGFPSKEYAVKYERRQVEEADDQDAAPAAYTNFMWPGTHEKLMWTVLKAIWMAENVPCPNCDVPLALVAVNWSRGMLSHRPARITHCCVRGCRRRFEAEEGRPLEWLAGVLKPHLRPDRLRWWREFGIDWSDPAPRLV